jgi:tripartite-type tricarboxylate transporter receptor subunit TctC
LDTSVPAKSADQQLLRVARQGRPAYRRRIHAIKQQQRHWTGGVGEAMQPISYWAAVVGLVALALPVPCASAQDDRHYPNRTVTIVAPSAPGGMYSILARLIGSKLERLYGKSFIVENRPGASSVTGALAVVRSPADGYTLMVATSSTMATNVTLHKNLPYNPLSDFIPVTLIALSPEVLLVNSVLPVRSIDDLVKLAQSTPGGLSFGSAGPGTAQHLNGELLKAVLGIEMHHIPYKGIQPALNDLAGGHIALMSAPIPVALPLVQGGRVRMLGVTTKERVEAIADVPALAEIGVPGYDAPSWFMLVAPAKTPRAIVDKLHADLKVVLSEADVREEFILRQGLIPVTSPPPDELRRFVASEIARLGDIVRKAGLAGSE